MVTMFTMPARDPLSMAVFFTRIILVFHALHEKHLSLVTQSRKGESPFPHHWLHLDNE